MRKLSNTVGMASLDMGIMKCGGGEGRRGEERTSGMASEVCIDKGIYMQGPSHRHITCKETKVSVNT